VFAAKGRIFWEAWPVCTVCFQGRSRRYAQSGEVSPSRNRHAHSRPTYTIEVYLQCSYVLLLVADFQSPSSAAVSTLKDVIHNKYMRRSSTPWRPRLIRLQFFMTFHGNAKVVRSLCAVDCSMSRVIHTRRSTRPQRTPHIHAAIS
jgi:hypothetical protein